MKEVYYPRLRERVFSETLENGLKILALPRPDYEKSFALVASGYGGADTRFLDGGDWLDTPAGIAHFLEHKMFDMPDGKSADERYAATGASANAFTSSSMTAYYFESAGCFEENLRTLLELAAKPYFTEASVEKEQGIIAQEIRMIEDNPDWQVYTNLLKALYSEHPLRVSVAGSVESIAEITPETLYSCHRRFYTPSNMVLCAAGNIDLKLLERLAAELLPAERLPAVPRDHGNEPPMPKESRVSMEMEVSIPRFCAGFKLPPPEGDALELELLCDLVMDALCGCSSPLYNRLYSEGLINSQFSGGSEVYPDAAALIVSGESREPEAVLAAVLDEARRVEREGFDPELFRRLKKASFGAKMRELNSLEAVCCSLAEGHFCGWSPFSFPEIFDSFTKERAERFAAEFIAEKRCALSVINERTGKK